MNSVFPSYAFKIEFFDEMAELVRPYVLTYHTEKGEIELFDIRNRRPFLKRTDNHTIQKKDLFIGNKILVNGRQYEIVEFADEPTRRTFEVNMQHTYAMIKPGFYNRMGEAIDRIYQEGLFIVNLRLGLISRETAMNFYGEHRGKPFYDSLVQYITSGPIVAMELVGNNAISRWRQIIGPTNLDTAKREAPNSLRALYARSTTENFAHGSDSPESAQRELGIIFGQHSVQLISTTDGCTCGVIRPHALKDGMAGKIIRDIVANGFEITGAMVANLDLATAGEFLEVYRGVVQDYSEMVKQLASGPCLALELRKDNAVQAFRDLCGPRDSQVAKQVRPSTLRAKYGSDVVFNAIHCTDLPEDAELETEYFFTLLDE
ncbi:Nucleoside diphosphate kinase family protein [Tritrichomonas foetus]|uniref:Nucleoside diphosphate kinase n=1 Tax=Tritrichomonas foetus TaxID=1144522 RepID=A0A1J4JL88_9EUKA|nr:nucleoside diphosphate kinase family protein [Tritrichomonas foetus]OHS98317.1 Nucleoside diphosphate kinase family protein [Tritrichomonas foetus]|eukprot:OHS98317.1 Nucleoside diphosphate kinase family protein [Tritrichomonas foetus]